MEAESKFFRTFFYQGHQIRTAEHNGETWWVASDVCKVLDIENVTQSVARLDSDEVCSTYIIDSLGRKQEMCIVNEPGLYTLILGSRKPEAKVFKRWVTHEVIPCIRKTGSYSLPQQEPAEPQQEPAKPQQQPVSEVSLQAYMLALSKDKLEHEVHYLHTMLATVEAAYNYKYPHLALSKDALMCEIHYLRALLVAVETIYNYKYPQVHNFEHPQEEHKPHPVETVALPSRDERPDLQTILLDYLHKTGSVTVRQLQQSGPRLLRNLPADQLRTMLQALVTSRVLTTVQVVKAEHYRLL
jgi:prophage antirepressor-like protein